MKCVKKNEEIRRVSDAVADDLIAKGWAFCGKQEEQGAGHQGRQGLRGLPPRGPGMTVHPGLHNQDQLAGLRKVLASLIEAIDMGHEVRLPGEFAVSRAYSRARGSVLSEFDPELAKPLVALREFIDTHMSEAYSAKHLLRMVSDGIWLAARMAVTEAECDAYLAENPPEYSSEDARTKDIVSKWFCPPRTGDLDFVTLVTDWSDEPIMFYPDGRMVIGDLTQQFMHGTNAAKFYEELCEACTAQKTTLSLVMESARNNPLKATDRYQELLAELKDGAEIIPLEGTE